MHGVTFPNFVLLNNMEMENYPNMNEIPPKEKF